MNTTIDPTWVACGKGTCSLRAVLIKEHEGGFSIIATRLPGCASQGDTREEAIANIKEAFRGIAECYKEAGEPIPWVNDGSYDEHVPPGIELSLTVQL